MIWYVNCDLFFLIANLFMIKDLMSSIQETILFYRIPLNIAYQNCVCIPSKKRDFNHL